MRAAERYREAYEPKITGKKSWAAALVLVLAGCAPSQSVSVEARSIPANSRTATIPEVVTPSVRTHQPPPHQASAVYFQPRVASLKDKNSLIVPSGVYKMVAEPNQSNSWTSSQGL